MHRCDHVQFGQAAVCHFLAAQRLRDDAVDLAASFQNRICNNPHDASVSPTVNQLKFAPDKNIRKVAGRIRILAASTQV